MISQNHITFRFLSCFFKTGIFLKKPFIYICFKLEIKVKEVFFVNKPNASLSICLHWVIDTAALGVRIWEAN